MVETVKDTLTKTLSNMSRSAVKAEGDWVDSDGLLVCGKCGQKKEKILRPAWWDTDTLGVSGTKVRQLCKCDLEEMERQKEELEKVEAKLMVRRLRDASLMDRRFSQSTFENCKDTEENRDNIALCKRYAKNFDTMLEKNQGLLFHGPVGTGKSYAAACIANDLMARGIPVIMTSFVKLLEVTNDKWMEEDIMGKLSTSKLVIFDDLGAERGTEYANEKVYNFVDTRYRSGKPMIITTNIDLQDMMAAEDIRSTRIYDRIFETCYPVKWEGMSWRSRTAEERFREMGKLLEV